MSSFNTRVRRRGIATGLTPLTIATLLLGAPSAARAQPAPAINLDSFPSAVFPAGRASAEVIITGPAQASARVTAMLNLTGATVGRQETATTLDPAGTRVLLSLDVPDAKPGVPLEAALVIRVDGPGLPTATAIKAILICPRNPWELEKERAKALDLKILDPEGTVKRALDPLSVPYQLLRSAAAVAAVTNGTVLVAESLSLLEHRALGGALIQAAAAGARVVCLAPTEGFMDLPAEGRPSLQLLHAEALHRSALRISPSEWLRVAPVLSTWTPNPQRRRFEGEWKAGAGGWSWMEARWPGGGSLVICGHSMVQGWDASPVPRHLLYSLLHDFPARNEHTKTTGDKP